MYGDFCQGMGWVEENIVCPRSELSNKDRVRIYDVTADSYEGHVVGKTLL